MVLLVLLLLFAGVWGFAISMSAALHNELQGMLVQHLTASVAYVADDLDRDILLQIDSLSRISAAITPEMLTDRERLQRFLDQRMDTMAIFPDGCFTVDRHGVVTASSPGPALLPRASVQDQDYFRQVMAEGQPVVGASLVVRSGQGEPTVPIAVPLHNRYGATAGMLVGLVRLSDPLMVGQLKQTRLGKSGYFLVVSPRDRLIVSAPDVERILQPLPPTGVSPLLDRLLAAGFEDAGIARDEYGAEILGASRRMMTNGWIVMGGIPSEEAFAPITAFKHRIYLTAFLISLLIAAILRFVLTLAFARLQYAGDAMRRMTENEAPFAPIPVTRQDEIGALIENFNRLAMERGRLDQQLRAEISERRQAQHALAGALMRLQALSERLTQVHEDERREFAYELHERSAQELSGLMLNLKMLRAHCSGKEANAQLDQANAIAQLALRRVRSMSINLHPPQLETFGLAAALQAYCTRQGADAGWALHFDSPHNDERPPRRVEVACFRVAQEALANVAQHAKATAVWVSLCDCAEGLKLSVRDDGIGFDAGDIHSSTGQHRLEPQELQPAAGQSYERADMPSSHKKFGLLGMEERVRQVGGRLEISSSPGHGTEICAIFPSSPLVHMRPAQEIRSANYPALSAQLQAG